MLTDAPSFQGSPEHLKKARAATQLPILRKDFLYDPYQVLEARAWGADCILIIMAAVDDDIARTLNKAAHDLGLDVLIEAHDEDELDRALALEGRLIGVNNRDLRSFETSLEVCERLMPLIPAGRIVVGESGIAIHADCRRLAEAGIEAFLVGEALMREADVTRGDADAADRNGGVAFARKKDDGGRARRRQADGSPSPVVETECRKGAHRRSAPVAARGASTMAPVAARGASTMAPVAARGASTMAPAAAKGASTIGAITPMVRRARWARKRSSTRKGTAPSNSRMHRVLGSSTASP